MLRFLTSDDLSREPRLADAMFRDRTAQFRDRLGWDLSVDGAGHERDVYDVESPIYVIWQTAEGGHGASARFLPTTGRTMVADHFRHLTDGVVLRSPFIWECTRFCLAPGAGGRAAAAVMLGGGVLMRRFCLTHFVGVFDAHMIRVYQRIGAVPEVLGSAGEGRARISVGLWGFTTEAESRLRDRAGLTSDLVDRWWQADAGAATPARRTA